MTKKHISILGSTGTIGINTLKVCRHLSDELEIVGLTTRTNIDLLREQNKQFQPLILAIMDEEKRKEFLNTLIPNSNVEILSGLSGLVKVATHPDVDMVVIATVGSIGLVPTIEAIRAGKSIALANKEVLVMAGELVMNEVKKNKVSLLPIDSEHNAIFQCLMSGKSNEIQKIILTCSGGPFRNHNGPFDQITLEQALNHPTWNMGKKITIDSATLMNKGLEVIECTHLFGIPPERIEVVIHPQSVIHSMVEFVDGSIIAQLSVTDMSLPIQFALTYPNRRPSSLPRLEIQSMANLTFEKPNNSKFPCLELGYRACRAGGTLPVVLNAANEIAVQAFIDKKITFTELPELIEKTIDLHIIQYNPSLEVILQVDQWARETAESFISI